MADTPRTALKSELKTAGRFAIVGAVATAIHLSLAQSLLMLDLASASFANLWGFLAAVFAGLTGHYFYTFERRGTYRRAAWRYGLIAVVGFLANNVLLQAMIASDLWNESLSLTIAIILVPAGTFLASRFWGFAR